LEEILPDLEQDIRREMEVEFGLLLKEKEN